MPPTPGRTLLNEPTRRAFSLVELIIVLMIGAVVAAVAIPRYGSSLANYRASAAGRLVAGQLQLALGAAGAGEVPGELAIANEGRTLRFTVYGPRAKRDWTVALAGEPYDASITGMTVGTSREDPTDGPTVAFTGFGLPEEPFCLLVSAGGGAVAVAVAADGAVTVSSPRGAKSVELVADARGRDAEASIVVRSGGAMSVR